ncbi:MAG: M15 family metallopeptidase [Alphaproteobacteria bacterium]|jgi:D-alanyl-D-alanine dipeptidase|nr:M15 family metallopeptidase [Alphaproteobacteria bacterium]
MFKLIETEQPPVLTKVSEKDGFVINTKFSDDFVIRKAIYNMLIKANALLPEGYYIVVYEAYRPMAVQKKLWHEVYDRLKEDNSKMSEQEISDATEVFVANPYKLGSGHQTGAAVDVSLCLNGLELDMGEEVRGFSSKAKFNSDEISLEQKNNRALLKSVMHEAGFINYPDEWWHYSYGERLWAELTNADKTLYLKLDR